MINTFVSVPDVCLSNSSITVNEYIYEYNPMHMTLSHLTIFSIIKQIFEISLTGLQTSQAHRIVNADKILRYVYHMCFWYTKINIWNVSILLTRFDTYAHERMYFKGYNTYLT